jgi:plastocyanin
MRPALILLALLGAALAGCGSSDSPKSASRPAPPAAAMTNKVDIASFKYKPRTIEIKAGTKVSFTNGDSAMHTATSKPQGKFDTGDITQGKTKAVTFAKPGDFAYYCVYHAFMKGSVKVVAK